MTASSLLVSISFIKMVKKNWPSRYLQLCNLQLRIMYYICVTIRTFPCELNNLSNSSLSKHAKKDTLLWVTDTGKSTDPNTQKNKVERSLTRVILQSLESSGWQQTVMPLKSSPLTPRPPLRHPRWALNTCIVCQHAEKKRDLKESQPQQFTEPQSKKKKINFDLYPWDWRQILLDSKYSLSVCTCKDEMHWLSGLIGPCKPWVLVGIHYECSVGE